MKLTTHEGRTREGTTTMRIKNKPMTVWLSKQHELTIERGDTLKDVAGVVRKLDAYSRMSMKMLHDLVSYWFDIGEAGAQYVAKKASPSRRFAPPR